MSNDEKYEKLQIQSTREAHASFEYYKAQITGVNEALEIKTSECNDLIIENGKLESANDELNQREKGSRVVHVFMGVAIVALVVILVLNNYKGGVQL